MMLIDKNGYYLYQSDNFYKYVIFMQNNCVNHGFICILLLLAVLVIGTRKNSCVFVHEDYRYNKNIHKAFGADNRGVNVSFKRKKWCNLESRINRLKRNYNVGARNLNEFSDAMTHIVRSVM